MQLLFMIIYKILQLCNNILLISVVYSEARNFALVTPGGIQCHLLCFRDL